MVDRTGRGVALEPASTFGVRAFVVAYITAVSLSAWARLVVLAVFVFCSHAELPECSVLVSLPRPVLCRAKPRFVWVWVMCWLRCVVYREV